MGVYENKKPNATCVVCGKEYDACFTCEEMRLQINSWRLNCDKPECFKVFMILEGYKAGDYSKEDAKLLLKENLTQDMLPYTDGAKRLIDEICGTTEPERANGIFSKKKKS